MHGLHTPAAAQCCYRKSILAKFCSEPNNLAAITDCWYYQSILGAQERARTGLEQNDPPGRRISECRIINLILLLTGLDAFYAIRPGNGSSLF